MNKLDQLREMSVVVADTGDIEAIRKYKPRDCTTNPSLILKAAALPGYAKLVNEAMQGNQAQGDTGVAVENMQEAARGAGNLDAAVDQLTVRIGAELTRIVTGDVSTEVDARLSFDKDAMTAKARRLIELYEGEGVGRDRILIKLATTWEGVQAARELREDGIRCNMTLVFCLEQAVAAAQAGAFLISPFVGRITDWYKKSTGTQDYLISEDPGVQSVKSIYEHFKRHGYQTVVMGASFRSAAQVEALAGCDRLTISPQYLGELAEDQGQLERQLTPTQDNQSEPELSEADFRWALTENAMAGEKLSEGIRLFHQDSQKLRQLLTRQMAQIE